MARSKSTNPFPNYIRVKEPDKAKLAELTVRAKGDNRSLNGFAKDCGVSPSTLSRLINQKSSRPNSDELIAAIANNAAPDSKVALEELLEAHGLVPVEVNHVSGEDDIIPPTKLLLHISDFHMSGDAGGSRELLQSAAKILRESSLERTAREIIQNSLLLHGYQVSVTVAENIMSIPSLRFVADFVVSTNALEECKIHKWAFDVFSGRSKPILFKISQMLGLAYLDSPLEKGMKLSVITDDAEEYAQVKSRFSNVKIKDCFSVILVDTLKREVLEEFQIPMENENAKKSVFV